MDRSSSSKVTVEYHDPYGLFPLVAPQLESRLPLRNLHWKSPTRPLRSIDSLHVDLVPSQETKIASRPSSRAAAQSSHDGASKLTDGGSGDGPTAPVKERRHQIPGLRQTPYLKVYLFRCDDNETYKATARKSLRDWIKANTPPSQSSSSVNKQENHDAYEWLILHVIVPDTPAASQPRWSSAGGSTTEKSSSSTRWPGRGSSTIFEKLRSDFNLSSKNAPDRVAQVRVQKIDDQNELTEGANRSGSLPYIESPEERQHAWNDVIAKFKSLILMSFDQRVGQYEEDIREKDAQRTLPGWNFCTFFVLKEGLARGFESVGLVDDALVSYDELAIGLDSVIREQQVKGDSFGGSFESFTKDLQEELRYAVTHPRQALSEEKLSTSLFGARPINAERKNYRELILQNKISVFEFRCYIFARQMALLLRIGNANTSRAQLMAKFQASIDNPSTSKGTVDDMAVGKKSGQQSDDVEDLVSLAEVCTRALSFITLASRVLREDLLSGNENSQASMIDNLVSSWCYSVAQQVLNETSSASISITSFVNEFGTSSASKLLSGGRGKEQKTVTPEPKTMMHPVRSSSTIQRRSTGHEPPYSITPTSSHIVYDNKSNRHSVGPAVMQQAPLPPKSGSEELAACRADLFVRQRRTLELVGKSGGWIIGWAALMEGELKSSGQFSDIDLADDQPAEVAKFVNDSNESHLTEPETLGLLNPQLSQAASDLDAFRNLYEALSDRAIRHYSAAGRQKSQESILGDLAALKYELGDYAAASMYFNRVAPIYADERWSLVEVIMLKLHAKCLRMLNRKDDYTRVILNLLAKSVAKERTRLSRTNGLSEFWVDDDDFDSSGLLDDLLEMSDELPYDISVPMMKYFDDVHVEPYQRHFPDRDGFQLQLHLRHLLRESLEVQKVKVRIVSVAEGHSREIWLEADEPYELKKGKHSLWVDTNVSTFGTFVVDTIILQARRITFVHELFSKTEASTPLGLAMSVSASSLIHAKKARILCYPRPQAFRAKIYQSRSVHIDKTRTIEVECSSGSNDIRHAELRFRSGSAGLRLRTSDAQVKEGIVTLKRASEPGLINLSAMSADSEATLQIPYVLENALQNLSIRLEVKYETDLGPFQFLALYNTPIELPLDVNVHDTFRHDIFWPSFNIGPATNTPLAVANVHLEGSYAFQVSSPLPEGHKISPQLPSCMATSRRPRTYNFVITRTMSVQEANRKQENSGSDHSSLPLTVTYECLDELVLAEVEGFFTATVKGSPFSHLSELLVPNFIQTLKDRLSPQDYERCVYERGIEMNKLNDLAWSDTLDYLPASLQTDLGDWLQKWQEDTKKLPFQAENWPSYAPGPLLRQIIIPVSIPNLHVFHTASLSMHDHDRSSQNVFPIVPLGVPFPATLRIKHTRRWGDQTQLQSVAGLDNPADPVEFVYDIDANPDLWLVCGSKRRAFHAREDEEQTFSVLLMPLRAGELPYPSVDIRPRFPSRQKAQSALAPPRITSTAISPGVQQLHPSPVPQGHSVELPIDAQDETEIACETFFINQGMAVRVVPDWRSCSLEVGAADEGGAGAVLVDAERRLIDGSLRVGAGKDSFVPRNMAHLAK